VSWVAENHWRNKMKLLAVVMALIFLSGCDAYAGGGGRVTFELSRDIQRVDDGDVSCYVLDQHRAMSCVVRK
jgi:hypothetical protein